MQVSKWGNSLAVRLPAAVVEALALKEGDEIEIHVAGARAFEVRGRPAARELLTSLLVVAILVFGGRAVVPRLLDRLARMGWELVRWQERNLYFGGVSAVERLADGSLAAAGDPRRGGHGIVVAA